MKLIFGESKTVMKANFLLSLFLLLVLAGCSDGAREAAVHNNKGADFFHKGLLDQAIHEYQEAVRLKPNFPIAHYNLGAAYHRKGLIEEAITEYKEALKQNPEFAEAHHDLGLALSEKNLPDDAIQEYQEAIRLKPDYADAYYSLGLAFQIKRLDDEAIKQYKKAIEIDPNDVEARTNLAWSLDAKGLVDQAIEEYKQAIKIDPKSSRSSLAYYNLGNIYHDKKMFDEATATFEKFLKVASPKHPKEIKTAQELINKMKTNRDAARTPTP